MVEIQLYVCEKCGAEFNTPERCKEHEKVCGIINTFVCSKCGEVITWENSDSHAKLIKNQCHTINLGRMGYGSALDGCEVVFQLCDQCLIEFIESFKHKEKIYNSGANWNAEMY